jgi:glycosyltransferase involved in cell wall biosynthesis
MIKFSVLISLYYNDHFEYFNKAIESIYELQSLKPNQVVIVCDGPILNTHELVLNFWKKKYPHIFEIYHLPVNIGLSGALNYGIKFCIHDYVARMDSDDISHPNRFLFQLKFLEKNPTTTVLGTSMFEFKNNIKNIVSYRKVPTTHFKIKDRFKYFCPINHPTVMFKKNDILEIGGYNNIFMKEDLDLWLRLLHNGYIFHNLSEDLVYFRLSDNLYKKRGGVKYTLSEFILINFRYKLKFINIFELLFLYFTILPIRLSPSFLRKFFYRLIRSS